MTAAAEHPTPVRGSADGLDLTPPSPLLPQAATMVRNQERLRQAALVAVEALEERARASRMILTDRVLCGLADPQSTRHSLERDLKAVHVLRAALRASET